MVIKWSKSAANQLLDILEYLDNNEQFDYSIKIEKEILSKISALIKNPKIYPADKLKDKNDGSFFAFEVGKYRISYRKLGTEIRILRIRHSKRKPLSY